jgi:hypothetical protein
MQIARAAEFMFAWSAADVYLLSIGAAVAELATLAKGTLPDFCSQLGTILQGALGRYLLSKAQGYFAVTPYA